MADTKIPKQFTVHREKWYRGKGAEHSSLRSRRDGKMCCVGFLAKACGLADADIAGKDTMGDVDPVFGDALLYDLARDLTNSCIYSTNDDKKLSEEQREKSLRSQFKDLGIRLIIKD